jgi:hypothetical protein
MNVCINVDPRRMVISHVLVWEHWFRAPHFIDDANHEEAQHLFEILVNCTLTLGGLFRIISISRQEHRAEGARQSVQHQRFPPWAKSDLLHLREVLHIWCGSCMLLIPWHLQERPRPTPRARQSTTTTAGLPFVMSQSRSFSRSIRSTLTIYGTLICMSSLDYARLQAP